MKKGFLSLVLHAHLPYVHHPEHDAFFEENWLFEAITECYLPLIKMFDRLHRDRIDFRLTLSLSPTLISMLGDDLLKSRYQKHLNNQIELAEKEVVRNHNEPELHKLARLYLRYFKSTRELYSKYQGDLLKAFKKYHAAGYLELITTSATHGFLPLLNINEASVRNQINIGLQSFKSNLGDSPSGFWLPECGYYPGLETLLADAGINYFFIDAHGVLDASEKPDNSVYAPIDCGNGVMAFARDPELSHLVWSSDNGYPGDVSYREYHSDIGFDLDLEIVGPYILDGNKRINTGIKYHRVTGDGQDKKVYDPKKALSKIKQDAKDFVTKCQQQINELSRHMDRPPIIVLPYDAELFGHWWFEGPCWLETVLRLVSDNNNNFKSISCGDYLTLQTSHQTAIPSTSTWGSEGYSSFWINEENDWIYPFLHKAANEMEKLALDFQGVTVTSLQERILNQAIRSLLLAQASDWPFIMKSGTTTEYAKKRITDHLARFNYLHESIRKNRIDERYLLALEIMDNIFPDLDYRNYQNISI